MRGHGAPSPAAALCVEEQLLQYRASRSKTHRLGRDTDASEENGRLYRLGSGGLGDQDTHTHLGGTRGQESACQCRRCRRLGFDPWVGKIP